MADQNKQGWFRKHKILTVILALIVIGGIAAAAGGGNKSSTGQNSSSNSAKAYRFNDRADRQPKDVELLPNESGTVGGVKLTVSNVRYATSLGEFDNADSGKTYLVADVALENTSNKTQPYNEADFRVQTASGQVLDTTVVASVTNLLNSGDLVAGGKASGSVVFQVPQENGHQYLIWKPGLASDRAIVQTK